MTVDKEAEKTAKKKIICYTRFTLKLFHNGKGDVHVLWRRQNNISSDASCWMPNLQAYLWVPRL